MRKSADERPQVFAEMRAGLLAIADSPDARTERSTVEDGAHQARGGAGRTRQIGGVRGIHPAGESARRVGCGEFRRGAVAAGSRCRSPGPVAVTHGQTGIASRIAEPDAVTGLRSVCPPVVISPPLPFVNGAARAARSLLFWKKPAHAVQLSVFERTIYPRQRAWLFLYAHLPDAFSGVATLCRALNPDAELLGGGHIQCLIPRRNHSSVPPHHKRGVRAEASRRSQWTGPTQSRAFELLVPREAPPGRRRQCCRPGANGRSGGGAIPGAGRFHAGQPVERVNSRGDVETDARPGRIPSRHPNRMTFRTRSSTG